MVTLQPKPLVDSFAYACTTDLRFSCCGSFGPSLPRIS